MTSLKFTANTPFRDMVDRTMPGAMLRRHPDTSVHTSTDGAMSPNHVPGSEKLPDVAAMEATLGYVTTSPENRTPTVYGPLTVDENVAATVCLSDRFELDVEITVLFPWNKEPGYSFNIVPVEVVIR